MPQSYCNALQTIIYFAANLMDRMQTTNCPNCQHVLTGPYCSNCGQKEVHRLTMSHLWHDLLHAFTHADKGFFYLMIQLFKRPGLVAREYIMEGKRKRYFLPLQYLVILGAIATIVVVNSHYIEETLKTMSVFTGASKGSPRQQAFMQNMALIQSKYFNFMILLQLPFYSMSAYIVYKKKKFNFAELLTLQTLITAQTTLISMVLIILFAVITPFSISYLNITTFIVSFAYQAWTYLQFFDDRPVTGILKALGSHLLGILFFILFAIIVGFFIGFIMSFS